MGMNYIVGYNSSAPVGKQWREVAVNSTADIYLHVLLADAIENKYPRIYEKITEQRGGHFVKFDELNAHEFMCVVVAIRGFRCLSEADKKGMELWNSLIEPLIMVDERYALQPA